MYKLLWKEKNQFEGAILKEVVTSRTAKNTFKIFKRFNKAELKLQDELIAKTFPETYIKYLENKEGGSEK